MTDSTGALLTHYWSRTGVAMMPPATATEIKVFEGKHSLRLPDDIRDYYLSASGFAPPHDQDANGFSFWPLARVAPVAGFDGGRWSVDDAAGCFLFADYLSLSWGYAFCLRPGSSTTRVCIVGTADRRPNWIADGFREFVELYIRDDERLYPLEESRLP